MSKNIVQMNNSFIQNEHQRRRYLMKERQKRNRLWVGSFLILLFILPTYNLAQSYMTVTATPSAIDRVERAVPNLSDEKDKESAFAAKLKDEDVAKYARAKYYYSKKREAIYTIPDLLPR
ncbi:septum formation initiator family protein (plasmid) [Streptococcus oralis]|uniref:septum formation initiator family protein n=1 Tax=Streptococcus oralis TaxID=1303 RepID=UPI00194FD5F7|nr:septum formation initiator family protein [Streptococcus oralis]QRO08475.1 septum formation initiator family protein [Streptococcus oralis]